jgi:hypothetical protein
LKKSTAKWKIVVGHHAIRSVGHHGDTEELKRRLLPILQVTEIVTLSVLIDNGRTKGFENLLIESKNF